MSCHAAIPRHPTACPCYSFAYTGNAAISRDPITDCNTTNSCHPFTYTSNTAISYHSTTDSGNTSISCGPYPSASYIATITSDGQMPS